MTLLDTIKDADARRTADLMVSTGMRAVTLSEAEYELALLGYELDRSMDARCRAKWMTGALAGETYPTTTTCIRQCDDKLSAFNADARRDANYTALRELRRTTFVVSRGGIIEL